MVDTTVIESIISGQYSDWFLDVFMTNVSLAIKNNLAILVILSYIFVRFARWTKWKWDDTLALWLRKKLAR